MNYSFRDVEQTNDRVWYRVRSVDIDGQYKLSSVVSVNALKQGSQQMFVLNNPAHGSIQLYAPDSYRGDCDYYLNTTSGQTIQKGKLRVTGVGNISIKLNPGITQGVYILQIKNTSQQFQERILIH